MDLGAVQLDRTLGIAWVCYVMGRERHPELADTVSDLATSSAGDTMAGGMEKLDDGLQSW